MQSNKKITLTGVNSTQLQDLKEKTIDILAQSKNQMPSVVAKQQALTPNDWHQMSRGEKEMHLMITLAAEMCISGNVVPSAMAGFGEYETTAQARAEEFAYGGEIMAYPQMNGQRRLNGFGAVSLKESSATSWNTNRSAGSCSSAGLDPWKVKSGGAYSSKGDAQLAKDVYAFQHYANYAMLNKAAPEDVFKDKGPNGDGVSNRDGMLGGATIQWLVCAINSGYKKVTSGSDDMPDAGQKIAKKLADNITSSEIDAAKSKPDESKVPAEPARVSCTELSASYLMSVPLEDIKSKPEHAAVSHCYDYIKNYRESASSGGVSESDVEAAIEGGDDATDALADAGVDTGAIDKLKNERGAIPPSSSPKREEAAEEKKGIDWLFWGLVAGGTALVGTAAYFAFKSPDKPKVPMGMPPQQMGKGMPPQQMGKGMPPQQMGKGMPPQQMGRGMPPQPMGRGMGGPGGMGQAGGRYSKKK